MRIKTLVALNFGFKKMMTWRASQGCSPPYTRASASPKEICGVSLGIARPTRVWPPFGIVFRVLRR